MTNTEPVQDWGEDFEIFDDAFVRDPYPVFAELRGQCPFARTERRQVSYMPTTFEGVRQVAGDTDNFSSFSVSVTPTPVSYDGEGGLLTRATRAIEPGEAVTVSYIDLSSGWVGAARSTHLREVHGLGARTAAERGTSRSSGATPP